MSKELKTLSIQSNKWLVTFSNQLAIIYISVFDKLIWHTIGPKSFLFGTARFSLWASGAVNYDYILTNNNNSLLIGSRFIPNGAHTNHV